MKLMHLFGFIIQEIKYGYSFWQLGSIDSILSLGVKS